MEELTFFNYDKKPFKIDKPIRLIELFAGIGSQAKALERLGADFEHYRVCEFDKYAIKSYNAIHGTDFATSDITQITADDLGIVDTDKYCYLMTYSFPCQDLSLAGKQKGMAKGENTRSGLLWEVERLLNECNELPQVLLMENVTQVHGKKNMEHFQEWIDFLESKGYSNYWKDLNAKNFGIPQNRNRTFMVSLLGDYTYEFPQEFPLQLRLKDVLEDCVEEKFYLSEKMITFFTENTRKQQAKGNGFKFAPTDGNACAKAVTTRAGGRMDDNFIKEPLAYDEQNGYVRKDGTVGTLTTDGSSPKHNNRVIEPVGSVEKTKQLLSDVENGEYQQDTAYGKYLFQSSRFEDKPIEECSQTIKSTKVDCGVIHNLRIRKLTPKECWRLMGFDDADFEKAAQINSNSQLYKQAGNSIVVDVLAHIFTQML